MKCLWIKMEKDTRHNIKATKEQLHKLYDNEERLQNDIKVLIVQLEQLQEDIEVAELLFMHQSNKLSRGKEWKR